MRDGNRRAALRGLVERSLDDLLRRRVQGRRRFIEKQDLWIAEQGASNSDTFWVVKSGGKDDARRGHVRFCPPDSWLPFPPTSVSNPLSFCQLDKDYALWVLTQADDG